MNHKNVLDEINTVIDSRTRYLGYCQFSEINNLLTKKGFRVASQVFRSKNIPDSCYIKYFDGTYFLFLELYEFDSNIYVPFKLHEFFI